MCVCSTSVIGLEGARSVRNDGSWRLMRSGFFNREQVLFSWVGSLKYVRSSVKCMGQHGRMRENVD